MHSTPSHTADPPYSYRVLGSLEVRQRNRRIDIPKGNTLNMLAALLLNANSLVPGDMLIERMWGDRPPRTARAVLQNSVSRLRSLTGSTRGAPVMPIPIVTGPGGYTLRVQPGALDLHRFDHIVADADRAIAEGRGRDAAGLLRQALSLWRDSTLPEVTAPGLGLVEIRRLREHRVAVLDRWAELELADGQANRVIPELRSAVVTMPMAERLHYQLIRALVDNHQIGEARQLLGETEAMLRDRYGLEARSVLDRWWRQLVTNTAGYGYRWPQLVSS